MDPRLQPGLLGTGASLLADLTLLAYLLLIVPGMLAGFIFARRGRYVPHHKLMMTAVTLFNWVLIVFLMAVSYRDGVAPEVPQGLGRLPILVPSVHLVLGAAAQLLATYLVLRMWLENRLPRWLLLRRFKHVMRLTLALWLVTAAFGTLTYTVWYLLPEDVAEAAPAPESTVTPDSNIQSPVVTEEAAPDDPPAAPVVTEEPAPPVTTEEPGP
jgi:uncharacterized membrane protein YozB (DUF420 family)